MSLRSQLDLWWTSLVVLVALWMVFELPSQSCILPVLRYRTQTCSWLLAFLKCMQFLLNWHQISWTQNKQVLDGGMIIYIETRDLVDRRGREITKVFSRGMSRSSLCHMARVKLSHCLRWRSEGSHFKRLSVSVLCYRLASITQPCSLLGSLFRLCLAFIYRKEYIRHTLAPFPIASRIFREHHWLVFCRCFIEDQCGFDCCRPWNDVDVSYVQLRKLSNCRRDTVANTIFTSTTMGSKQRW